MDLAELGISEEELQERLVKHLAQKLLTSSRISCDEDGEYRRDETTDSRWALETRKAVRTMLDAELKKLAAAHVQPVLRTYLETLVLKKTNQWGEKKEENQTFIEYLIERSRKFLDDEIDDHGRTREECSYTFTPVGKRCHVWVSQHLRDSISAAMKTIVEQANASIVDTLKAAVNAKLEELGKQFTFTAEAKPKK